MIEKRGRFGATETVSSHGATADSSDRRPVICTIQHPAHVHFFRNAIEELETRGYPVHVFVREKGIVPKLLDIYDVEHQRLAGDANSLPALAREQVKYEYGLFKRVRKLDPAVLLAIAEPAIAHASTVFDCQSVLFTDTEHATLQNVLAFPFSDVICTPEPYWEDLGEKQVRYGGYHELAYLHPNRFSPDPAILDRIGVSERDRLVVVRLVSWTAAHDVGKTGIEDVETIVDRLERFGATVVISSERPLPPSLEARRIDLPPDRIHDVLAYADLFVGESGTMTLESALLGTPAMYVSPLYAGVLEELEERYGLVFSHQDGPSRETVLEQARALLRTDPSVWRRRRQAVLEDKVDTTAFVVRTVAELTDGRPLEEVTAP